MGQRVKGDKPEPKEAAKVKVLSLRPGNVVMQDGRVLKFKQTIVVSEAEAEWLVDSFKDQMLRV